MYSAIKYKNTIVDGAKHLYDEIVLVRTLCTEDERKVANKSIQDNAWFAHPENIIIATCAVSEVFLNLIINVERLK